MEKEIFKLNIGGKELKVEIRRLAERAGGDVLVQYGETMVLATAVMSENEVESDFFPLTVEYEEKYYAAGKILGSRYIRRETRPSDEAIITARFIDRALRPRFPENLKREVQIIVTCLSWDKENDPDIIGLIAASLALSLSPIPWLGPVAVVRIGQLNSEEKFIINPTYQEREKSYLDLALAGVLSPDNKEVIINMIEMEGNEVSEEIILKAAALAQTELKKLIDFQKEIIQKLGQEKIKLPEPKRDEKLEKEIKEFLGDRLNQALGSMDLLNSLKKELIEYITNKYAELEKINYAKKFFETELDRILRENILLYEKRPDGRRLNEIRKISSEIGLLPRTHGSGLFIRGQTKALSILTLGAPGDVKLLQGLELTGKKRFMHHYNFPPYSVGEVKPLRGPSRRDIGHGMLAEKALFPLLPDFDKFPYTIRIVTEILSSNGSTSMAAVSSSSLALMDAGVPIKRPAAGIALGLIQDERGNFKILTDIQGPEDHHGDMDFKIAGTEKGITAMQMDVKIAGINQTILEKALQQGREARLQILNEISKTITQPKPHLSPYAPRILIVQINPGKIREVIGPGGKMINEIIDECGVAIDIEDTGRIFITAEKEEAAEKAAAWIKNIVREVKVNEVFQGKVTRILNFGAFVEILPKQEGLLHISQLKPYKVKRIEDIIKVGDIIPVKVISIDEQGRINLTLAKPVKKQRKSTTIYSK